MRKKFIAGNWKMYTSLATAKQLAADIAKGVTEDKVTVAICPPFPWLMPLSEALKGTHVSLVRRTVTTRKRGLSLAILHLKCSWKPAASSSSSAIANDGTGLPSPISFSIAK